MYKPFYDLTFNCALHRVNLIRAKHELHSPAGL